MKVGLMLPGMQSLQINEAMLQAFVAMGADSLWMPDHMLGAVHPALWPEYPASAMLPDPDAFLDPFCVAAALGRQTELPFGTCVTDGTRRRGADLARTALTLNDACRGGFILGIGAGEAESLLPFGYDFTRPVGRLEETLREARAMLDTGRMPGDGIGRTGLPLCTAEGRRPQIWLAGSRERSLELTGRYADGWMPVGIGAEEYAQKMAYLDGVADSVGRPPLTGSMFPLTVLGESRAQIDAALEASPLAKLILLYAPATLWQRYGLEHPNGPTCRGTADAIPHVLDPHELRSLAQRIPKPMVDEFMMYGNADELTALLQPYARAGLDHVVICDFTAFVHAPEVTMSLMGSQLPRLVQNLRAMPARGAVRSPAPSRAVSA